MLCLDACILVIEFITGPLDDQYTLQGYTSDLLSVFKADPSFLTYVAENALFHKVRNLAMDLVHENMVERWWEETASMNEHERPQFFNHHGKNLLRVAGPWVFRENTKLVLSILTPATNNILNNDRYISTPID